MFSAALGGPAFDLLWDLARRGTLELVSTRRCLEEARRNLSRKRPERLRELERRMTDVTPVAEIPDHLEMASFLLPPSDAPVLASAISARARILLTGDIRHFGPLMDRSDLPLKVKTVRAFLLEGFK